MNDQQKDDGLYFGGVPTDIELARLRERYQVPEEGQVIPYAEIAELIGTPRESTRFKTVTDRWRSVLWREYNVLVGVERGVGFKVLSPDERVDHGSSKYRGGLRAVKRGSAVVTSSDRARMSEESQRRADHVAQVTAAVIGAARVESKRVRAQLPLPKTEK